MIWKYIQGLPVCIETRGVIMIILLRMLCFAITWMEKKRGWKGQIVFLGVHDDDMKNVAVILRRHLLEGCVHQSGAYDGRFSRVSKTICTTNFCMTVGIWIGSKNQKHIGRQLGLFKT